MSTKGSAMEKVMDERKLVSIVTPAFNSEKTISRFISSVLEQTYENWELIIVDDASLDGTIQTAEKFTDPRIRILRMEKNSGAAIARNFGIKNAKGSYLAFCDSDDTMEADRLDVQVSFLNKNPECDFCYAPYFVEKPNGKTFVFQPKKCAAYKDILKSCYIGCSTVMLDLEKNPDFQMATDCPKREDFVSWLDLLKNGRVARSCEKPIAHYFLGGDSVSGKKGEMICFQWEAYRKHEKLGIFKSSLLMLCWAWTGFWKYRI